MNDSGGTYQCAAMWWTTKAEATYTTSVPGTKMNSSRCAGVVQPRKLAQRARVQWPCANERHPVLSSKHRQLLEERRRNRTRGKLGPGREEPHCLRVRDENRSPRPLTSSMVEDHDYPPPKSRPRFRLAPSAPARSSVNPITLQQSLVLANRLARGVRHPAAELGLHHERMECSVLPNAP